MTSYQFPPSSQKEMDGNMVVLSKDAYKNTLFESEVYSKLQAAEQEADFTNQRFSSNDVLKAISDTIDRKAVL